MPPRGSKRNRARAPGKHKPAREIPANVAKAVFIAGLLGWSLAATFISSEAAFSDFDLGAIVVIAVALNGAILCGINVALRFGCPGWLANLLLTALTVFGIVTAYAIHAVTNALWLWALLGAIAFPLFVAFGVMDRWRWAVPRLAVLALLALAPFVAGYWWWQQGQEAPSVTVRDPNIRAITFARKPNVYFISFDGAAPRAVLRKYLGIETTALHDLFDARLRRFENFFANAIHTKHSISTVLALTEHAYGTILQQVAKTAADGDWDPLLFSGHNRSPLLETFKRNGYETTTVYQDTYFGRRKGPHVDRYFIIHKRTVCGLLDGDLRAFSFWGYCSLFDFSDGADASSQVIDRLRDIARRDRPQFAMAHIYRPGHTDGSFRYDDATALAAFRALYLRKSDEAAERLAQLLRHLDENDPQAIVLVYSDHGALLSRGMAFEAHPGFVVQDNYGILGGVYPHGACREWLDDAAAAQSHLTVLDAVHAVLRCLADGEPVLRYSRGAHRIGDWHGVVPGGWTMGYEPFVYE